jgi:hypothetical protein
MTAAESAVAAPAGRRSKGGRIAALARKVKNLVIGTLMCMTPVTAIIALGWMVRYMRSVSLCRLDPDAATDKTGWVLGPRDAGFLKRLFGGAWLNLRTGFGSFVALALATLPFTGLWLGSWWAGWENSFNKGYEQFWVGPTLGLTGVAVGLWVMAHLPMALAHQAVEGRPFALFEIRRVRRLVAAAGWRYVFLAGLIVFAGLPLFAARGLPAFVEGIIPGFSELPAEQIQSFAGLIALVKAGYIFVSLVILRGWTAGLYAHAAERIRLGGEPGLWSGSFIERSAKGPWPNEPVKRSWFLFRFVRFVLLLAIWFGLVAQIYLGQFLNQNWWYWVNHPYLVLPWSV